MVGNSRELRKFVPKPIPMLEMQRLHFFETDKERFRSRRVVTITGQFCNQLSLTNNMAVAKVYVLLGLGKMFRQHCPIHAEITLQGGIHHCCVKFKQTV